MSKTDVVFIAGHSCCKEFRLAALENGKIVLTTADNVFWLLDPSETYHLNYKESCQSGMKDLSRPVQVDKIFEEGYKVDMMVFCCVKGPGFQDNKIDDVWTALHSKLVFIHPVTMLITSACT